MATIVDRQDPRFRVAHRGRNQRFPSADADAAGRVEYCVTPEDAAVALQKVLDAGLRPTVRSSGHCYEDFVVNNPNGAILDVSLLNAITSRPEGSGPFHIQPGAMLGNIYQDLYKRANVVLPGGTCFTVTAGGHVSGGGYGLLARLRGITCDWLSSIDILTVDAHGKVNPLRVDKKHDADLFRALRGGQGSNFGLITSFSFDELPPAPEELMQASISFDWASMTPDRFVEILTTYGKYWEEHDRVKDTWGLFGVLNLNNKSSGRFGINAYFTNPDGTVNDLSVLTDFLDRFQRCKPIAEAPPDYNAHDLRRAGSSRNLQRPMIGDSVCYGEHVMTKSTWIEAASSGNGSGIGGGSRAKYKSAYMKKSFTEGEALAFYKMLSSESSQGLVIAVDSYGGATNDPERAKDTAISQRSSIMKLQYMSYWQDVSDDEGRLKGMRDTYTAAYSTDVADKSHAGTPYPNDHYEGCYMNYPDADMLEHSYWPQLFYGTGDLYPFLQGVKRKHDPHNVFHHAMSVRI
ncbi:FAD-binding protein [Granulicella arctica]|uniref:FAD-binding protein n=1 Tax=Granulicella arctica TaxID=940613 RepID=UPI0021E0505F|nr:FAD-binding protein [Granulicella arctica]